jgi:hypothetical protein
MPTSQRPARRRTRYRSGRIKQSQTYDPAEAAQLLGIHRNTVRHWLKNGLAAIDNRRPTLISGTALRAFIAERQHARRQPCAIGEFFCFRCRTPRRPWGGLADISRRTEKISRLSALCSVCETAMYRTIRASDVSKWAKSLELHTLAPERLISCPDASANSDLEKPRPHEQNQSW